MVTQSQTQCCAARLSSIRCIGLLVALKHLGAFVAIGARTLHRYLRQSRDLRAGYKPLLSARLLILPVSGSAVYFRLQPILIHSSMTGRQIVSPIGTPCCQCREKHKKCDDGFPECMHNRNPFRPSIKLMNLLLGSHCLYDNRGRPCEDLPGITRWSVGRRATTAAIITQSSPARLLAARSMDHVTPPRSTSSGPSIRALPSFETSESLTFSTNLQQVTHHDPLAGSSVYQLPTPRPSTEPLPEDALLQLITGSLVVRTSSAHFEDLIRLYESLAYMHGLQEAIDRGSAHLVRELNYLSDEFLARRFRGLQDALDNPGVSAGVQSALMFGYIDLYCRHSQPNRQFYHELGSLRAVHERHHPQGHEWIQLSSDLQRYLCHFGFHPTSQAVYTYCACCRGYIQSTSDASGHH